MEHHHEKTGRMEAHVHRHESAHDGHPHEHHAGPAGQRMDHSGHDKHAGHSPRMFRNRFFVSLLLTLPILYDAQLFQQWLGYRAVQFAGSEWITPVLAVVIFFYGGWPFVEGARPGLAAGGPGVMRPCGGGTSVGCTYR